MTPKEKAEEIFEKYFDMKWQSYNKRASSIKSMTKNAAKQCALIAVDEILDVLVRIFESYEERNYWEQVKEEINKL